MQNHGHIGGSMSIADVLSVIMDDFDIKKDEIIFSKGHASPALYSAFYLNNIITKKEIDGFRKIDGTLEGHPSIHTKGVKVATRIFRTRIICWTSEWHFGKKMSRDKGRVYVIVGDRRNARRKHLGSIKCYF